MYSLFYLYSSPTQQTITAQKVDAVIHCYAKYDSKNDRHPGFQFNIKKAQKRAGYQ